MSNIENHFPFLELQANILRSGRDVALSPLTFFSQESLAMLPLIELTDLARGLVVSLRR